MKKPIIAVDADDVLSHNVPEFMRWSNQRYGLQLTVDDYDEDWARMWQVDHAEATRRNMEFHESGVMASYRHHDQAVPILTKLQQHFELVVITSRPKRLKDLTLEWLDQNYPELFSEVYFAGMWDVITADSHKATKAELAQRLGVSYLIDDQPKHVLAVAEAGMEAILFGEYPWNQDVVLQKRVRRCKDWAAVQEFFDGRN